ncbi:MAG: type II toxin-antitoxin system RelE/ParE family toxin [Theionarchaea archaeon]|nr:type II toxin-antitoxin system RelE/ParE family toxin [Theionarchaea archaeon]
MRGIEQQYILQIIKAIESLADNPFPSQCHKLRGTGNLYRIRIGDYRVIYQIESRKKTVIIYYIRHRKKVYKKLK